MGHVNNAAYVDYLEESVSAAGDDAGEALRGTPRRVRIEYVLAAIPGSVLSSAAWPRDGLDGEAGWAWRLSDSAGGPDTTRGLVLPGV